MLHLKWARGSRDMPAPRSRPIVLAIESTMDIPMKPLKRAIALLLVAWMATACASLPPAPSYVRSPFNDMHGQ